MKETMTTKERWLAAIKMKPVDRLPFWPKILGDAYSKVQGPPFSSLTVEQVHDWIGSDKHLGLPGCIREVRQKTSVETVESKDTLQTCYHTPHGDTALLQKFDEPSCSWHPVRFPARTPEDIKLMTEIYEDVMVELDADGLEKSRKQSEEIGQTALTHVALGESALMHWVEWVAGVENAHFLLADCQDEVENLFEAMHRVLLDKTRLLCEHSPADIFYLYENTSTTLISPAQYRRYCAPHITEYAGLCQAAGRNLVLHMCGHIKALLPDLARIPVPAFEAFTSPTLGNTTLLDGRTQCPNTCLIGGTNAMLWIRPADEIIARIGKDLDELPHHRGIVVTSAGLMPPSCRPETIKRVCEWVKKYPARMNGPQA